MASHGVGGSGCALYNPAVGSNPAESTQFGTDIFSDKLLMAGGTVQDSLLSRETREEGRRAAESAAGYVQEALSKFASPGGWQMVWQNPSVVCLCWRLASGMAKLLCELASAGGGGRDQGTHARTQIPERSVIATFLILG